MGKAQETLQQSRNMKASTPLTRLFLTAAPLAFALMGHASAATITFQLDQRFSDDVTLPAGAAPWLTLTVTDTTPGTVQIDFIAANLSAGEFVSEWYLNLDQLLDPANLVFSSATKTGTFDVLAVDKGANAFKADADGYYDIRVSFSSSEANRFDTTDKLSYSVSYTGGNLSASSFYFQSGNGTDIQYGPFYSAAHVNSTPAGGNGSAWLGAIPEPSSALGALLGFGMWLGFARKRTS
jgi:hypothetical protein